MSNSKIVFTVTHAYAGACRVDGSVVPLSYEDFMQVFSRVAKDSKNVKITDTSYSYPDSDGFEREDVSFHIQIVFYPKASRTVEGFVNEIHLLCFRYFSRWLSSPVLPTQEFFYQDLERLIKKYIRLK